MADRYLSSDDKDLFPASWIVGPAAANLVRDDEGVLLADAAPEADSGDDLEAVVDRARRGRPSAREIAELHAEMERLERRFAAASERRLLRRHQAAGPEWTPVPAETRQVREDTRTPAPPRRGGWLILSLALGAAIIAGLLLSGVAGGLLLR